MNKSQKNVIKELIEASTIQQKSLGDLQSDLRNFTSNAAPMIINDVIRGLEISLDKLNFLRKSAKKTA
jgi:hypothetical protein